MKTRIQKSNYEPLNLNQVSEEEWKRFAKQTAKRLIRNGLADGRKRHIGDYSHKRLLLKFGCALPTEENKLRTAWFDRVDDEIYDQKLNMRYGSNLVT